MRWTRRSFFGLLPGAAAAAVVAPEALSHGIKAAIGRIGSCPVKTWYPTFINPDWDHSADAYKYAVELIRENELFSMLPFEDSPYDAMGYPRTEQHPYMKGYTG